MAKKSEEGWDYADASAAAPVQLPREEGQPEPWEKSAGPDEAMSAEDAANPEYWAVPKDEEPAEDEEEDGEEEGE